MDDWNRIVRRFEDDLLRPEHGRQVERCQAVIERLRSSGMALRCDHERSFEHAHVLVGLERLGVLRAGRLVVDFGGGNAPLAYVIAAAGAAVEVLDQDARAVLALERNAHQLGLAGLLAARLCDGRRWPQADASADAVLCVSVWESLLRPLRPVFFAECRRVLRPGGALLLTCDYGPDARFVGDAPARREELAALVAASGMQLRGALPPEPEFDPALGPPVRTTVPTVDGEGRRTIAYTFAALHLARA